MLSIFIVGALVILATTFYLLWWYGEKSVVLPGPKRRFLVGNLYDLPHGGEEWIKYRQLGKACGEYSYFFSTKCILISTLQAATLFISNF